LIAKNLEGQEWLFETYPSLVFTCGNQQYSSNNSSYDGNQVTWKDTITFYITNENMLLVRLRGSGTLENVFIGSSIPLQRVFEYKHAVEWIHLFLNDKPVVQLLIEMTYEGHALTNLLQPTSATTPISLQQQPIYGSNPMTMQQQPVYGSNPMTTQQPNPVIIQQQPTPATNPIIVQQPAQTTPQTVIINEGDPNYYPSSSYYGGGYPYTYPIISPIYLGGPLYRGYGGGFGHCGGWGGLGGYHGGWGFGGHHGGWGGFGGHHGGGFGHGGHR